MSGGDAHWLVQLAKRLRQLPITQQAWLDGVLSSGQVQAISLHVGRKLALFAEHEPDVVPTLAALTLSETVEVLAEWRRRADAIDDPEHPEPVDPPSTLHLSPVLDRGRLDADLNAEDHAVVAAALRVADSGDLDVLAPHRRADALVDICTFFLDHQNMKPGGRHRPHVNLIVNAEDWTGGIAGGPKLPASVLDRYACDCTIHRVLTDSRSAILDLGVATRVLTAALWTALIIRDTHCRFPGCDRPATWCDGHHIQWVSHGGPTNLDNLILVCRRHHKRLHQPGWHAKLLPDNTLEITDPTGLVRSTRPPGQLPLVA